MNSVTCFDRFHILLSHHALVVLQECEALSSDMGLRCFTVGCIAGVLYRRTLLTLALRNTVETLQLAFLAPVELDSILSLDHRLILDYTPPEPGAENVPNKLRVVALIDDCLVLSLLPPLEVHIIRKADHLQKVLHIAVVAPKNSVQIECLLLQVTLAWLQLVFAVVRIHHKAKGVGCCRLLLRPSVLR